MHADPDSETITRLLAGTRGGDREALSALVGILYKDLHRIATLRMRGERADHTLQPTALVNEAMLRLLGSGTLSIQDRAHFLGAAAQAMRHTLTDHARARRATKRAGGLRVTLDPELVGATAGALDAIVLDEALGRLASAEPRWARVVELRFLAGMEVDEVAQLLQVSERTVKRDWRFARAWLARELILQDDTS